MKKKLGVFFVLALALSVFGLTGCDDAVDIDGNSDVAVEKSVQLYFANEEYVNTGDESKGILVEPENAKLLIEKDDERDKESLYEETLDTLEATTPQTGKINCLTPEMIDDVSVFVGKVTVDMDRQHIINISDLEEKIIVMQIVNTLFKNFPEIKEINFKVDEMSVETLNGHIDISKPFTEMFK